MASISFDKTAKRYDSTPIIADFTLDIEDGEFMVFVGPSGCGKSTALRMIAGLESVSEGEIRIGGRVVNALAPKDRDVAMVFQSYALYPHMSVAENIGFGLKIRKIAREEIARRVAAVAASLELGDLLDRKPRELSGGQRQRVALGRAIVRQPQAFLFDEPLSNLDAELRVSMRAEIARLQRALGATMVYVTHDQVEAMTLGRRIAVLSPLARGGGRNLMQVGRPMDLYERPQSVFVARAIGSPPMSILEARVDETGAAARIGAQTWPLPARYDLGPLAKAGTQILIGVRAEHAETAPPAPGRAAVRVEGHVSSLERLGHEALVRLEVEGGSIVGRMAGAWGGAEPRVGDPYALHIDADRLHVFDAANERRVGERASGGAL